jgi:hypothetical protein
VATYDLKPELKPEMSAIPEEVKQHLRKKRML